MDLAWFRSNGFRYGLILSVLWHLLWLFAVRVDVNAARSPFGVKPSIHFMGAVIDDTFFEVLVKSRPESGRTAYRALETEEILEPSPVELTRELPEGIVHTPFVSSSRALVGVLGGKRGLADNVLGRTLSFQTLQSPYPLSGALSDRDLYYLQIG